MIKIQDFSTTINIATKPYFYVCEANIGFECNTFKMAVCLQPFHTMSIHSFVCSKLGEDQAEAKAADVVDRKADATERQTTATGIIDPATTTEHAARPTLRTCWICLGIAAVVPKPVLTPLPYIATHVINAKLVSFLSFHRVEVVATIAIIPCHFFNIVATAVLSMLALVAATSSELPFCFGRQAEALARFFIQLLNKLLTIMPTDILYWQIISFKI